MTQLAEIDALIADLTDCLDHLDGLELSIPALHVDRALHALQAERILAIFDQEQSASTGNH